MLADVAQTINLSLSVNSTNDGNKFYLNNVRQSIINFRKGDTIIIDVSAVGKSSSNHPIKFSTTENGTHNGGSSYTTDITESGDYITINTTSNTPSNLYYYCELHSDMGSSIVHSDNISVATHGLYFSKIFWCWFNTTASGGLIINGSGAITLDTSSNVKSILNYIDNTDLETFDGSTNIVELGTITSGIWQQKLQILILIVRQFGMGNKMN